MPQIISFGDEKIQFNELSQACLINIGNLSESFLIYLSFWSKKKFIENWIFSIEKCLQKKSNIIVLPKSMYEITEMNFFAAWVFYIESDNVFIQDRLIFLEDFNYKINLFELDTCISTRREFTDEGRKISQWQCNLNDIYQLLDELKQELKQELNSKNSNNSTNSTLDINFDKIGD